MQCVFEVYYHSCYSTECVHSNKKFSNSIYIFSRVSHTKLIMYRKTRNFWLTFSRNSPACLLQMELLRQPCSNRILSLSWAQGDDFKSSMTTYGQVIDYMLPNCQVCMLCHLSIAAGLPNKKKIYI